MNATFKQFVREVQRLGKQFWLDFPVMESHLFPPYGRVELLCRVSPFQIERICGETAAKVPMHRHPTVDSCEFFLSGNYTVWIANKEVAALDDSPFVPHPVFHTVWHGGQSTGPAKFLSVQHWLEGSIDQITVNWENKEGGSPTMQIEGLDA
jgi:quercetin dioxygenase-like cupin family protein